MQAFFQAVVLMPLWVWMLGIAMIISGIVATIWLIVIKFKEREK